MIELSVVIATYQRRDTLRETLSKLAEQTYSPSRFEVLVVDDGSTDGTGEMVTSLIGATPYTLRYFHHANRGPGATQNRGIREAHADLVLLIADDIHPTPTMLESHLREHQKYPEPHIAILGQVLQSPQLPPTSFLQKWDPFRFRQLKEAQELPYWKFWACNISLKRQFLLENGLYRELKGAAHEDVELGYRLCQRGLRIFYNPEALGYHYHPETLQSASARAYERGLNWRFIEESIPDPDIHVKYHLLNFHTLKYHYQTFRRLSQSKIPPEDRFLPWLLFRQMIRWIFFNQLTVPYFWTPLLEKAEENPSLASVTHPYLYRGVVFYQFIRGEAHSRRQSKSDASAAWSVR